MTAATLILEMAAEPTMPVGYATQFRCQVLRVADGTFDAKTLFLTVLTSDPDISDLLTDHPEPHVLTVGFEQTSQDAPYATMPVTGFVDEARNVWTIRFVRLAKEE